MSQSPAENSAILTRSLHRIHSAVAGFLGMHMGKHVLLLHAVFEVTSTFQPEPNRQEKGSNYCHCSLFPILENMQMSLCCVKPCRMQLLLKMFYIVT